MTERSGSAPDRVGIALDGTTRQARLAARLAGIAVLLAAFALLTGASARAGDPAAAARELGRAGQAQAGAIVRDASNADAVPGYAGTNLPERGIAASGMEDAARRVLADPQHPGGAAGTSVIEGTATRPVVNVPAGDPAVRRGLGVADSPQGPAHGASGLASGTVADCGADVPDAERGGSCGRVTWCVGAGCETVRPQANTGFVNATARLNMVMEMGGDEFDRGSLRFFTGQRRACHIRWGGLANCCRNSGALVGLANCSPGERELARERHDGNTHYLGKYCSKKTFFGVCIRRSRAWCVFGSKLGRILQQQGRAQLRVGWGSCRGLTVAEIERIDFDRLDLTEFTENLMDGAVEPAVALPGAGDTQGAMRTRIRAFYRRGP